MLGGISGHAGLFSDANDLGVIGQMLLQEGTYGSKRYLEAETIKEFTRRQFPLNDNRRGVGFDKPLPEYTSEGPACKSASSASYGHMGFTGTYIWVDPESQLVYVFLSNRVYPDAENNKLATMQIRPKIHQLFYNAIKKSTTFGH
jgi:CubicO group peptidase (beta-lactamase class C family)